jgi:hypothetical protein
VVAAAQIGAAEALDIPDQEAILLSDHDAAGGVPEVSLRCGCDGVHVPATVWFGFVGFILIIP